MVRLVANAMTYTAVSAEFQFQYGAIGSHTQKYVCGPVNGFQFQYGAIGRI